jgi:hypothetical protein
MKLGTGLVGKKGSKIAWIVSTEHKFKIKKWDNTSLSYILIGRKIPE